MPPTDRVRDTLARYAEPLLREVTARFVRPRTAVPADEAVEEFTATWLRAMTPPRRRR